HDPLRTLIIVKIKLLTRRCKKLYLASATKSGFSHRGRTTLPENNRRVDMASPAPASHAAGQSKGLIWTGRIMSLLATLFLLMDAAMKLMKPQFVIDATVQLGYPEYTIIPLGIVLTICTLLYAFPPTAVLGAILLTGYLGGAVSTHVRHGD